MQFKKKIFELFKYMSVIQQEGENTVNNYSLNVMKDGYLEEFKHTLCLSYVIILLFST